MTDKEKYEQALEKAKLLKLSECDKNDALEEIFPELKESEDEKIRKSLIEHFEKYESCTFDGVSSKDILAWLEKQKPANWKPSKELMDVLYALCYLTDVIDDHKDTVLIKLYQDLKQEFFNGASYENMFSKEEKQKTADDTLKGGDIVTDQYNRTFLVLANVAERNYTEENSFYCESLVLGVDGVVYSNGTDFIGYRKATEKERAKFLHDLKTGVDIKCKPAEWSEEDEEKINKLLELVQNIEDFQGIPNRFEKYKDMLKSLRPQKQWKPTEEQIDALEFAAELSIYPEFYTKRKVLAELLEQLKAL